MEDLLVQPAVAPQPSVAGGKSIAVPAGRPLVEVFAPLLCCQAERDCSADCFGADVSVWSKPESHDDSDD